MSAVRGTFSDFKTVKTRGVCQLIVEVPIESADHALQVLGGVPQAKAEQWVGIAPITAPAIADDKTPKPERLKGGMRAQHAGRLLGEPAFIMHALALTLPEKCPTPQSPSRPMPDGAKRAREMVCMYCGVSSLRELDHDDVAGRIFDQLTGNFYDNQQGRTDEDLSVQRNAGP